MQALMSPSIYKYIYIFFFISWEGVREKKITLMETSTPCKLSIEFKNDQINNGIAEKCERFKSNYHLTS